MFQMLIKVCIFDAARLDVINVAKAGSFKKKKN